MFSVFWREIRTPRDRGATAFIPLEYDVCGDVHRICHLLGIRYDTFDVTSWVTAISGKPLAIAYQPVTAIPE